MEERNAGGSVTAALLRTGRIGGGGREGGGVGMVEVGRAGGKCIQRFGGKFGWDIACSLSS